ncbi:MAG: aldo/keto reductase [Solimonas sp.]
MHPADRPQSPNVGASFELYDLRVEVVAPPGARIYCGAKVGDWFELRGEMLHLPPGQAFSIYSLSAILPLLPAKQRETDPHDWMTSDAEVACPDPNCPSRFRITRLGKRRFLRADTTAVPLPGEGAAKKTASAALPPIPRIALAPDYEISRLIKGGWHLAGDHGDIDPEQALHDMAAFVESGITTFDCADIYTSVEQKIGDFRRRYPSLTRQLRVHTKFVPDLADLDKVDGKLVRFGIERSIKRLAVERVDLVQFHWWNFDKPGYVEAAIELAKLQKEGRIDRIGVTNFDVAHLQELLAAGVPVFAHQLQYSLLDQRPENGMVELCRQHDIALLCYGTVAGGFLSERWLDKPEPVAPFANRSLVKYKLIIDDFGGWELFQTLLRVLAGIAAKHDCDIATVATAAVLQRERVAAAIVGATNTAHLPAHRRIGAVTLDAGDLALIDTVARHRKGPLGDVYQLERDITGPHGRIMKYDLHK